jgi:hypothetical protein
MKNIEQSTINGMFNLGLEGEGNNEKPFFEADPAGYVPRVGVDAGDSGSRS